MLIFGLCTQHVSHLRAMTIKAWSIESGSETQENTPTFSIIYTTCFKGFKMYIPFINAMLKNYKVNKSIPI